MKKEDFYIGWNDHLPARSKKAVVRLLIPLFIALPLISFSVVYFMKPFNDHRFELGKVKEFTGIYQANPYPMFILSESYIPKEGFDNHALLVGFGKSGAKGIMTNIEKEKGPITGKKLKIQGTLIYGDGRILIELTHKEKSLLSILDGPALASIPSERIEKELNGEIVDPKCWFGAMKPAEGKVHKSCAIRCISGGIPPVLRVGEKAPYFYYILTSATGEPINQSILKYIAEPVSISGASYQQNGWNILEIAVKDIRFIKS